MAGDLDFSVQLRLLNDQFNNGINEARDKFTAYAESVQRNVTQMNADTERATASLAGLGNVRPDRLTAEIRATADQLRNMGAGANLSGEQVQNAMHTAAGQVTRLGTELNEAKLEAARLAQTGASPRDLEAAAQKVNRLETELNEARSASVSLANELSGAMNRASNTADGARNAIYRITNIRVPETIRGEIDQISRSLVDFQRNSGRPAEEIDRVTRAAQEQIRRLEAELRGLDETQDRTTEGSNNLGGGVNRLRGAFGSLQGLLAAAGLGIGVSEIIETADAFKTLEARVKLATGEGASFVNGFAGVKQIANETFSSVENTGELFARITQASEALGLAQGEVLSITRTINEAIKLSGGSAASADAAITQLIQGLQSGVVRGDEFNSIMEQSPRLAQAMADGLGVTRGELRAMAMDGKLSSEVVINAIRSQGDVIASEFGTLPTTVGNSLQVLKNQIFNFVGEIDGALNQTSQLADAISYIGNNLEDLDPGIVTALTGSFESTVGVVIELANGIKLVYDTFNGVINAISGGSADAAEQVGLITAALHGLNILMGFVKDGFSAIGVAAGFVVASLYGAMSDLANIAASITFGDVSKSFKQTADELQVKSKETWESAEQDVLDWESSGAQAIVNAGKTTKEHFAEVAADSEAAYRKMVDDANSTAEQREEALTKYALDSIKANDNVVSDKLRVELAEKNLQAVISDTGKVSIESAKEAQAAYLGVGESFAEVALKAQESGKSIELSLAEAIHKANTRGAVEDISNSLQAMANQGLITGEQLALGQNIAKTQMSNVEAQIAQNMETFGDYAAGVLAKNGNIITAELQHAASLENLAIQMDETGNVMITELDASTIASKRTKDQIDELAGAVGVGLSKEFIKSSEGLNELVDGFDDLEKAGYDAKGALVGALTEMTNKAKNTAELDNLRATWIELGKEGKLSAKDLKDGLDDVNNKADLLTEGINSVTEAYGFLGIKTREELAKNAALYTEANKLVMAEGKLTAQQQQEVFEKTAKANIAANNGVIDSFTKSQAAALGFTVAVDENGRVTVEKMGQAKTANDKVTTSVNGIKTAYNGIASSAGAAGQAMVGAANQAASAYDKLQKKIQAAKEAMELKKGDETLKNLRIYGKEEAPAEGNQFGSKLAVENFLKSQGLSEAAAIEEARKLYAKSGKRDGALNFGDLQGYKDGQVLTNADLGKFKTASMYLAEIASKARDAERQRDSRETARTATARITTQEYGRFDSQPTASKTIDVNFKLGGASASLTMPENQEGALMALLQQLQDSKAIAGY
ncbi:MULTISPECIES: tape measure protein [unclassified Psychrobacter]|uniref:tape measure protein n=1 Tax=unclassified Psychrobacter TaxID=196806 RepID=UPI0025FDE6B9|nr:MULTISPECIES: tape measure protein [unclassified Psychrobacter]